MKNNLILSTEEQLWLQIQSEKKEEEIRMKKGQRNFEKMRSLGTACIPVVRSTKPLTIPSTPYSHVDLRMGKKEISSVAQVLFPEERKSSYVHRIEKKGPTLPEPFHFQTATRAIKRGDENAAPAINSVLTLTAAELVQKFQNDPRSHDAPLVSRSLTLPQSPKLLTNDRCHRRELPRSTMELKEEKDLAEMNCVFKARPFDSKLFVSNQDPSVQKQQPKRITEFSEFNLATEQRSNIRKQRTVDPSLSSSFKKPFKARPMPNFQVKRVIKNKTTTNTFKPTRPKSPNLMTKKRSSSAPPARKSSGQLHLGERNQPHKASDNIQRGRTSRRATSAAPSRITEPKEFQFQTERRGQIHKALLEQRLRAEETAMEEARIVKAVPIAPNLNKPFIPKPSNKELTEFLEFNLASLARHRDASAAFLRDLEDADRKARAEAEFKALAVPTTTFVQPQTPCAPHEPVVPLPIVMATDVRMSRRKEYDDMVAVRRVEEEQRRREAEEMLRLEEEKYIRELRTKSVAEGGLMFLASEIMKVDPFPPRPPAPHPLTEPVSPALHTATRARSTLGSQQGTEHLT